MGETATLTVEITFTTEGELPTDEELEELISNQMSGELDEDDLAAVVVVVVNRKA
jgi:hypothetical protein